MKNRTALVFNTSLVVMPVLSLLSLKANSPALTVTLFTISYHLLTNMLAGFLSKVIAFSGDERYFTVSAREMEWYRLAGVRKWKDHAPTYEPEAYECRSLKALRRATVGAEVCHLIGIAFSVVPVIAAIFSDYLRSGMPAFVITTLLLVVFNLALISIQRFNRYRIDRIIERPGV